MKKKLIITGAVVLLAICTFFAVSGGTGVTSFSDEATYRDVYHYYADIGGVDARNEALAMLEELHFFYHPGTEIQYEYYKYRIEHIR